MSRPSPRRAGPLLAGAALAALTLGACGSADKAAAPTTTTVPATSTTVPASTTVTTVATTSTAPATTATTTGSSTTAAGGSACATDSLTVATSGPTDAGAGSVSYPLTFTNKGSATCTLEGYPGVSAVTSGGQTIGQPANKVAVTGSPSTVKLAPGVTASAVLRVAQAGNFDPSTCGTPQTPYALRVFPPGQTASVNVTFSVPVCPGSAQQLSINPITASS